MKTLICSLALVVVACGNADIEEQTELQDFTDQDIVGGNGQAAGYDAVGALFGYTTTSPKVRTMMCGVVLVHQRIAITAGHCVDDPAVTGPYDVTFGKLNHTTSRSSTGELRNIAVPTGKLYRVSDAIIHPDYRDGSTPNADIAALRLAEPVLDRVPASMGGASTGCNATAVGYGRTTAGAANGIQNAGYTYERKSVAACVYNISPQWVSTSESNGSVCYGDSGSGLMLTGKNTVVGLISRNATGGVDCATAQNGLHTNVATFAPWVRAKFPATITPTPSTPPARPSCGILPANSTMSRGEQLTDCEGKGIRLVYQAEGNLVLYQGWKPLWWSSAGGTNSTSLNMQGDGNLVLYAGTTPLWNTQTNGHAGARLAVQPDCNLVVYSAEGRPLWASGTQCFSLSALLAPGQGLAPGQSIRSANGAAQLIYQTDGNLVLYGPGRALWSTQTNGRTLGLAIMQGDGNFVLYDAATTPLYNTQTNGRAGAYLRLQTDCNLGVYSWDNQLLRWLYHGGC